MDNDARHDCATDIRGTKRDHHTTHAHTHTQHTQVYAAVVRKMNASAALNFVFESGLAHGFRNYDVCDAAPCDRIIAQLWSGLWPGPVCRPSELITPSSSDHRDLLLKRPCHLMVGVSPCHLVGGCRAAAPLSGRRAAWAVARCTTF